MIISRLAGGLGNQLFQYAAGRSLALHHKTELLLDASAFADNQIRNFELSAFNAEIQIASAVQAHNFTDRSFAGRIRDRIFPIGFRRFYKEPFFHFDKNFFKASSQVYLKGYWQSEKYFTPFRKIIRSDLSFKPAVIEKVRSMAIQLINTNSVAVHIRRADYTSDVFKEYHGILDKSYYESAIQLIKERIPDASFYFFSDDSNWLKENFSVQNAFYVSGEISKTHFEDLYLMSQCRHNIIANSSFSWWGAWLNDNPEKIVIAPANWFNKGPQDTYDLYPDGWVVI